MDSKDYKYIILLLIIAIIGVFTFYYGTEDSQIVSYIGFAGTISSLILSVVAMIYTFYQSTTSANHTQKLSETSDTFIQTIQEFKETQHQLAETKNQLAVTVDSMQYIGQQVATMDYKLDIFTQKLVNPIPESAATSSESPSNSKETLERILSMSSILGILALVICVYQVEKFKNKKFREILEEVNSHSSYEMNIEYSYGFLVGLNCNGLFHVPFIGEVFKVEIPNIEEFKEVLSNAITAIMARKENIDYIIIIYEAIVKCYGYDIGLLKK